MHAPRKAVVPEKRGAGFRSEGSWGLTAGVRGSELLSVSLSEEEGPEEMCGPFKTPKLA